MKKPLQPAEIATIIGIAAIIVALASYTGVTFAECDAKGGALFLSPIRGFFCVQVIPL